MNRRLLCLLTLFAATGCSREEPYRAVVRDQTAAYEELTEVLKTVRDEKSMEGARAELAERNGRFAAIAERAKSLGPPSAEIIEKLSGERDTMKLAFIRFRAEYDRVKRLPGGEAFV